MLRYTTVCLLAFAVSPWQVSQSQRRPEGPSLTRSTPAVVVDVTAESFRLENGLAVVVSPDSSTPNVSVELWTKAGTAGELTGEYGFAHLFEHMFGARRIFTKPGARERFLDQALDTNAQTRMDYARYFVQVPASSLEMALAMQADRLDSDPAAYTQARLDADRNIVINEVRRAEERVERNPNLQFKIRRGLFDRVHPYSHEVYGLKEDLSAATPEAIQKWARRFQGASNALLLIAGNVTVESVRPLVTRYFASIAPGVAVDGPVEWVARRNGNQREVTTYPVARTVVFRSWQIPAWGAADADYLTLINEILVSGSASRLNRRLTQEDGLAESVLGEVSLWKLAGTANLEIRLRPGADADRVGKVVDEEVNKFIATGPGVRELDSAKERFLSNFVRSFEQLGFFGERIQALGEGMLFRGDPLSFRKRLERIQKATGVDLTQAARRWLTESSYELVVNPSPSLQTVGTAPDRTSLPVASSMPTPQFPKVESAQLSNGLKILLVERHNLPLTQMTLAVDAGKAADSLKTQGMASLTLSMLRDGTATRSGEHITDAFSQLGARFVTTTDADLSLLTLAVLSRRFDGALELMADMAINATFPQEAFDRAKAQRIAQIKSDSETLLTLRWRLLPMLLYGDDTGYAGPLDGSGATASISQASRAQVASFHHTWFRPNNATLIVVGDVSLDRVVTLAERHFRNWRAGTVPKKGLPSASAAKSGIYLIDRPGASQSFIVAAQIVPVLEANDIQLARAVNLLLGSRLNGNLRTKNQWSYGAQTTLVDSAGPRILYADAPVQTDKTAEAVREIISEFPSPSRTIDATEIDGLKRSLRRTAVSATATLESLVTNLTEISRSSLPLDYYDQTGRRIDALTPQAVEAAATRWLKPQRLVWIIVGDRKLIEAPLRALGIGEVHIVSQGDSH